MERVSQTDILRRSATANGRARMSFAGDRTQLLSAAFLLLAEHFLLLTHGGLVALLELALLARLLGVLHHLAVQLLVIHHIAYREHLRDCDDIGEEIIIAQTAGVVVEPQKHHDGHHI